MSGDLQEIKSYLNVIVTNQDNQGLEIAKIQTQLETINDRGCLSGDWKQKELMNEIAKVDEKHDKRAIGFVGTILLLAVSGIGTLLTYKFGK